MSSWFNLSALSETGSKLVDVYTRDFSEFANAISTETSHLVTEAASSLKSSISLIDGVGDDDDENNNDSKQQNYSAAQKKTMIRSLEQSQESFQQRLNELESDKNTFLQFLFSSEKLEENQPNNNNRNEEENEQENSSKKKWNVIDYTDQIAQLLQNNENVRRMHEELVPVTISYDQFWHHYFANVQRFMSEEDQKRKLLKTLLVHSTELNESEQLEGWDSDDDDEDDDAENYNEDGGGENEENSSFTVLKMRYSKLKSTILTLLENNNGEKDENDENDDEKVQLFKKQINDLLCRECPFIFEEESSSSSRQLVERDQDEEDLLSRRVMDDEDEESGGQMLTDEEMTTSASSSFSSSSKTTLTDSVASSSAKSKHSSKEQEKEEENAAAEGGEGDDEDDDDDWEWKPNCSNVINVVN